MTSVDVLVIAALREEYYAARAAGLRLTAGTSAEWQKNGQSTSVPYETLQIPSASGAPLTIALARPTRKGGRSTAPLATALAERLSPQCLAMPGVCAGNPEAVALGDIVVAEMTYEYDEGKLTAADFAGDHRHLLLDDVWLRAVQEFSPAKLPSYGPITHDEATVWFLERLLAGDEPRNHPARPRYFPDSIWHTWPAEMQARGLIVRSGQGWALTDGGRRFVEQRLYDDVDGPARLPFAVKVAPMASGSATVEDGLTWAHLAQMGVRTVAALEMEAATVATVARQQQIQYWLVVKGVVDYADPRKDDRYKRFAARASAEVLYALVTWLVIPRVAHKQPTTGNGNAVSGASQMTPVVQLDQLAAIDPVSDASNRVNGHLYLTVRPRAAVEDALGPICTPSAAAELNAAVQRALASRPRKAPFVPDFSAGSWRRSSKGIHRTDGVWEDGFVREASLLALTICEDGSVTVLCGRATDQARPVWKLVGAPERGTTRPVIFPDLLLGLTHSALAIAVDLGQRYAAYHGPWDIGLRLTGIKGAVAYDHVHNGDDDTVHPYDENIYERTLTTTGTDLAGSTAGTAERLVAPLLRALTIDSRYLPYSTG